MPCEISTSVRVFVIESSRTTLWGLERLIESAIGTMTLSGSAIRVKDAVHQIKEAAPDVILFSAICSDADALDDISTLSESSRARILVLTAKPDVLLQEKAILAGARGVVDSEAAPERVLIAIKKIYEGEVWVNRMSVNRILEECASRQSLRLDPEQRKIATLTGRERQLVATVVTHPGATAKTIADLLNISAHTARNHLNAVYGKLQVANRVELFDFARRHRLFETEAFALVKHRLPTSLANDASNGPPACLRQSPVTARP